MVSSPTARQIIRKKIFSFWEILLAITLVSVGLVSWPIERIKTQTETDLSETLKTALAITNEAIGIWHNERKSDGLTWAASEKLIAAIQKQLAIPRNRDDLLASPALAELDIIFKAATARHFYLGYDVLTPDGLIIASRYKPNIGRQIPGIEQDEVYRKALHGECCVISQPIISEPPPTDKGEFIEDAPSLFIVAPVFDEANRVIALFCLRMDAEELSRITKLGRMGNTGETYVFDKNGRLLTESRFDLHSLPGLVSQKKRDILSVDIRDPGGDTTQGFAPKIPREQQPLTYMAADAIASNSGVNVKGYRDYRGVTVVGAWTWNQDLQVGITTEIDWDMAYLPYIHSRNTILFALCIATLLFSVIFILDRSRKRVFALTNALIEEQTHLRALIKNVAEGIVTADEHDIIILFNPAAERMFGYAANEAVGKDLYQLMVPERYRQNARDGLRRFFETEEGAVLSKTQGIFALRRDGTEFPVEVSIAKMRTNGGREVIAIARDITQRIEEERKLKFAEQQLSLSKKMASIGQLSEGVCHEILNPLNIISLQAQLLLQREKGNPDLIERLTKIRGEIGRIKKIVGMLTTFAGKGNSELKPSLINGELDAALSLVEKDFNLDNIKIVRDSQSPLPEMKIDTDEMRQVFLNLTNNARYEMRGGGILTVKTRLEKVGDRDHVRICFCDTGSGIKKEHLTKIFDPFFTTKPEGKGTGMGLSTAHSIVEKHGGTIIAESEEGKGTTFIIDLPLDK